ncbi:GNAT family N-acetyltransferase [Deinococcus radiomollis]|uniref:GNAT family N-acetyltransferase n=1 Tax=Deinococcus radiomollis TaxID=468916 RepID=UPI0038924125
MTFLETERLLLAELPLKIARQRLAQQRLGTPGFLAEVLLPAGPQAVTFPAAWPGDALGFFPGLLTRAAERSGQFILIRRHDLCALGLMGDKGGPDANGDLEIGYGLNPDAWNQGYASEALRALLPHWYAQSGVSRVTAQTATSNPASARVLEKCGFVVVGESWDEEDGPLLVWATTPD